ncbi:contractile injection system protein, VgrG/Pvc8 family [Undibacterium curvum]|uniref:contractile injection system protein, VgrG/Pvc8 family n=1 Tax=Undibacterium curvum TaxID=2762294 RepID=UPI003D11D8F7
MNARVDQVANFNVAAIPQPAQPLHVAIFLPQRGIVSDEVFRLVSFQGQDSSSDLFEYELELHANTTSHSGGTLFNLDDLLGAVITVGIEFPSLYTQEEMTQRFLAAVNQTLSPAAGPEFAFFNGIISAFAMADQGVYRVTMKPALARLKLSNAYRMHRQMNVRDTIADLLDQYTMLYSMQIAGNSNMAVARVQDWLQAGESDYDFIVRLMGKAYLYYYFIHTATSHTIVFANYQSYPSVYPDAPAFRYRSTDLEALGANEPDVITQYSYQRSLSSSSVNGIFTRQYATWESQPLLTFHSEAAQKALNSGDLPFYLFKSYQYGDTGDEVLDYTEAARAAFEAESIQFSGTSFCPHFRAGHQFHLGSIASQATPKDRLNHPEIVRPSFADCDFVLTQVKHTATADGEYKNEFQATKASGLISKFSMQETQQGNLLAVVIGYSGDPEPSNWTHFLPANFSPEHSSFRDNNSPKPLYQPTGVYVNFCTDADGQTPVFVKLGSSMTTVPEVGALVMVSRAQDESELPEIQNVIATDGSKCIMPTGWDASTRVGNNYSTSYGDANNISFGQYSQADLPNAIGIILNKYNTGLYRDSSYSQGTSYSFSVAESVAASFVPNASELWGPYGGAADISSASESSGSSYSRQYAAVTSSFSNIGTSYSNSTTGKSESHALTTGTTYSESTQNGKVTTISTINADSSNTSTQTGDAVNSTTNNGKITTDTTVNGDTFSSSLNNGNTTSSNIIAGINTSDALTAMSVSNSLTGLSMNNTVLALSNNTALTGAAVNTNLTGVTNDTTLVGMSTSTSLRALVDDTSLTGMTSSMSLTGMSSSNSITGMSNSLTLTGTSVSTNLTGTSTSTSLTGVSSSVSIEGSVSSMSMKGMSNSLDIVGQSNSMSIKGSSNSIELWGSASELKLGPAVTDLKLSGPAMKILTAIQLFL